jgi:hypothetical protein
MVAARAVPKQREHRRRRQQPLGGSDDAAAIGLARRGRVFQRHDVHAHLAVFRTTQVSREPALPVRGVPRRDRAEQPGEPDRPRAAQKCLLAVAREIGD